MDELVKRLREASALKYEGELDQIISRKDCATVADEIERLRAALKPFAESRVFNSDGDDVLGRADIGDDFELHEFASTDLRIGHIRAARRALEQSERPK